MIYKLFPYNSLFHNDGNTLTAWWVLVTILVFAAFVIRIINITRRLKTNVNNLTKNFESISTNNLLKSIWRDYSETFLDFLGNKKTDEYSYDYFNEKNLLTTNTNIKLLTSIPSILVGLGILGTFVGLTYGITNFKTSSTEEIKGSIETLLSGMGTAFVSSIWGMSLSLIFTFIEKFQINTLHNSIHQLCYKLDRKYKVSKEDERKLELARQREIISEYFIFTDENNNKVKPANVFRDIYEESKKQSKALQAFATDLALKIEAGFETIMINQIQKGVIPELQSLKAEIETLGKKLQDPTTEMTQNVVKELNSSLSKMIVDFRNTLTGSTKSELEKLAGLIADAGVSLRELPNKLEDTTNRMTELINKISLNMNEKVGELQVGQEVLINKQSENLQVSENLLNAFNNSIEKLNSLTDGVSETITKFSKVQSELNSTAGQLKNISDNVNISTESFLKAQLNFGEHSNKFFADNQKTIEEIQKSLTQAKNVSADYAQKFQVIEKGLQQIFSQIQSGLTDYRDTIGESLESFLGKYTQALTKTAESLSGAATKQEDILEEFTEQLSKLNGKKI